MLGDPRQVGGRIAFQAGRLGRQFIMTEKGERIGGDYEFVSVPRSVGGRIAFWAREGVKYFIINESGERSPVSMISWATPRTLTGRSSSGKEKTKWSSLQRRGNGIGETYDTIRDPVSVADESHSGLSRGASTWR